MTFLVLVLFSLSVCYIDWINDVSYMVLLLLTKTLLGIKLQRTIQNINCFHVYFFHTHNTAPLVWVVLYNFIKNNEKNTL